MIGKHNKMEIEMNKLITSMGGKSKLTDWVIQVIPKHKKYVEVFGGGGYILLNKKQSAHEIYNDLDIGLVAVFNSAKRYPNKFINKLSKIPLTKQTYNSLCQIAFDDEYEKLHSIDKAVIKTYIQLTSIAGRYGSGFKYPPSSINSKASLHKRIGSVHKQLKNVHISNLNYAECILKHDSKLTLFYCDPPYFGKEDVYANCIDRPFTYDDHILLSEILKQIKGKVILSYYYDESILSMYEGWYLVNKVTNKESGTTKQNGTAHELLLMNFKPKKNIKYGIAETLF